MTYKHKSKNITCTVLDATSSYVIYQYISDGIRYTNKVRAMDFMSKREVFNGFGK